jgi:hypothetical protein
MGRKKEEVTRPSSEDFCDVPARFFGQTQPVQGKRFGQPQGVGIRPLGEGLSLVPIWETRPSLGVHAESDPIELTVLSNLKDVIGYFKLDRASLWHKTHPEES